MADNIKVISRNRRASHDYHLEEFYEAGLVLMGSEIKSIRAGHINISEAYVQERNGELWVLNMYIAPYEQAAQKGHDPYRERKLLLNRREIDRIALDVARKGYTIVPTQLYLKGAFAKLEIAMAKGKRQYDKRQDLKERDDERRMRSALKDY
ncbi:MAG: SsrA-binding protein SmpB [Chloroflexi bacterium]|nr:SsrA-binding protein SmpB [Chloroflexota bacterium]